MKQQLLRLLALCLAFVPATAWAHEDHHGLQGMVHVLTNPVHLGLALFGLILAGFGWRWFSRNPHRGDRDDAG